MSTIPAELLQTLAGIVGEKGLVTDPDAMAPHLTEWRGRWTGRTPAVVKPATTEEVSAVVAACAAARVAIVPQGGNTGLVGGQIPDAGGGQIVLSLARMTRVRAADATNGTLTVEAGVTLLQCQEEARRMGWLFPLSLASEGSCTIGGNLATNAGGTAVLKYGNARALCLGVEAVLADGTVLPGLRALLKDNTGYDLKDLLIGSEGTLGIITAAVLRLFPLPSATETAMVAVESPSDAVQLLQLMRAASGDRVTTFELIPRRAVDFVLDHTQGGADPFEEAHPWYVLVELSSGGKAEELRTLMEDALAEAFEKSLVTDAALAQTGEQARRFWEVRELISEAQKPEGGSIKHDISVPVGSIPDFIARADAAVGAACPGIRPLAFGHIGDGNVHYNLSQPIGADTAAYLARTDELTAIVHGVTAELSGSISAEHGLGQMKVDEIAHYKSAAELSAMRAIKRALDPHNLLNPGKVVRV
ncbi:FAD-binding oxidoreductase [Futiania mangrovi]|uniref:FAD-binding oxidoreductase n=1 Tax=Futiania mangrovi TaxID=2959716 RepID=A0A9J6P7S7_9PROT|nr:FAD-binding oxidoreductase [Futiania mangrovii]MCP1335092.1 FAD-binding oxidoreductase [Futiania mangrovii]